MGLRSNYETIAENRSYFKGKILFPEQQKYNISHKERVFTESDEFTPNCPGKQTDQIDINAFI